MTIQMHEFVVHPDSPRARHIFIPLSIAAWDIFFGTLIFLGYVQTKRHLWLYMSIVCFMLGTILCAMGIAALKIFLEERGKSKTLDNKEHIENKA